MKTAILAIIVWALCLSGWVLNIVKLAKCDFEPSYKTEVVRVIGIFTPISIVTGWMSIGEEDDAEQRENEG